MINPLAETFGLKAAPEQAPAAIPCSMDLARHFHRFVKYWAGTDVDYLGQASDNPMEMPVELVVRWKGSVGGTLVLRCFPDFLTWLPESRAYKPLNLCTGMEIFTEMTTLYCIYLIQQFWLTENFELGPILLRPSTPAQWPAREPHATCGILVDHHPVEIRLWMD